MWPEKNTAFIIVHGNLPKAPFECLDDFVGSFRECLKNKSPDRKIKWHHRLLRHENWIENYLSLQPEDGPILDFYEYYWDCYMTGNITSKEALDWIKKVAKGAKSFYDRNKHIVSQSLNNRDKEIRFGKTLIIWGMAASLLEALAKISLLNLLVKPLLKRFYKGLTYLFNDVVVYTTTDARCEHYETRQKILRGAVEEIKLLLENDRYEKIILAGHSLGSLILYDTLNRLNIDMNTPGGLPAYKARKIAGLVTFGSPLDKVSHFYREHIPKNKFIRRQIIEHFHGFKHLPQIDCVTVWEDIDNPILPYLDGIRWINFYHEKDPLSGYLDTYADVKNMECTDPVRGWIKAHGVYWHSKKMYESIAGEFF